LDENDNDLVLFLRYVIAAVQTLFPGACPETSNLLRAPQLPPQHHLATTLINEVSELQPAPDSDGGPGLTLVLDDYHKIEDESVHQLVAALVGSRLLQMHLVIAGRTEPPLPLARLRVGRQMTEIRTQDLRFTRGEAQAFLDAAIGEPLSDEAITTLEERTEGWIAGLRLAAISMRSTLSMRGPDGLVGFVYSFEGTHRDLVDYLMIEVLSHQAPTVQEFLLRTSILERFCAPLCDEVLDIGGWKLGDDRPSMLGSQFPASSQPIIEELDRANLFLVPLDHERRWYRYHHLFQEMLHHRLPSYMSEQEIASMHRKASAWFAQHGGTDEALHHALAAGDVLEAARLVEVSRFDALNRGDWRTLERRLKRLPDEVVWRWPGLLVTQAWTLWYQFRLRDIESLLDEAESRLDPADTALTESKEETLRGEIDALRSYTSRLLRSDVQLSLECSERALRQLPRVHPTARGVALAFLCLAYQSVGQKDKAVRLLTRATTEPMHHSAYRMQAFISLSFVHFLSGELKQVDQSASRFLEYAIAEKQMPNIGWAHYWLGLVHYEWNDLEALREHSVKVTGAASSPDIGAFQALLALTQGDKASAVQWARSIDPLTVKESFAVLQPPSLTRERILIAQGTTTGLQEAVRDLQKLLTAAQEVYNTRRVIQVLAHLALAYDAQGQNKHVVEALERAILLARPGGFIRAFVDLGPGMAPLLYQLAERGVAPDYVARVLAAFPSATKDEGQGTKLPQRSFVARSGPSSVVEPLTRRELEILELIEQGLSNKEIAQELVISPQTVKRHASNIYAKLGVSGRVKAVAEAKSLGILPPD
jgi:LuxR family maltose regulon positive regulatory protein